MIVRFSFTNLSHNASPFFPLLSLLMSFRAPRTSVKTVTYTKKPTAFSRQAAARSAAVYKSKKTFTRNRAIPYVKGAIAAYGGRKELKYVDLSAFTSAVDTTGSVSCLNLLAIGDDNTTRDGRQVTLKSVQVQVGLQPQSTTTTPTACLMMLVWDNAVNSAATIPAITDIMTASTALSFPKVDNAQRFTILWKSFSHQSNQGVLATSVAPVKGFNIYKKLNHTVQYSGTTAAIGSIQNGGLYLVTLGSVANGTAWNAVCCTRVRYTDS